MDLFNPIISLIEPAAGAGEEEPAFVKGAVLKARVLESGPAGQVRLKIGPRLIQAVLSQYLEPGLTVRLRVMETSPQVTLALIEEDAPPREKPVPTPIAGTTAGPGPERPNIAALVLAPPRGDLVRLRVTVPPPALRDAAPVPPGQKAPTLAPGREISARLLGTELVENIRPGRELRFEVAETFPRLVLRVLESPPPGPPKETAPGPTLIKNAAAHLARPAQVPWEAAELLDRMPEVRALPPEIQTLAARLPPLLAGLSPRPQTSDPQFLGRLLEAFGLGREGAGLKETVARLFSEAARSPEIEILKDNPAWRSVLESAARLYEALDRLGAINQETWPREQVLHLAFPLFWPEGEGRGELR
ncbi:MAG: hypothetical protein AB1896_09515, partial [Thermodesulfobacteriota bacterium]